MFFYQKLFLFFWGLYLFFSSSFSGIFNIFFFLIDFINIQFFSCFNWTGKFLIICCYCIIIILTFWLIDFISSFILSSNFGSSSVCCSSGFFGSALGFISFNSSFTNGLLSIFSFYLDLFSQPF